MPVPPFLSLHFTHQSYIHNFIRKFKFSTMVFKKKAKLGIGYDHDHHQCFADQCSNNNSSETLQTLVRFIPEEVILEHILPKSSVKSLLRFKSVSKLWLSTISAPEFAKSQFNSYSSPPQLIMVNEHVGNVSLLPYDEPSNRVQKSIPLKFEYDSLEGNKLVGSCNGLVCIYIICWFKEYGAFVVWNPATGQHRDISLPDDVCQFEAYGFGYVSSQDDYKIVGFHREEQDYYYDYEDEDEDAVVDRFAHLYVYSLSSGKWTRISTSKQDVASLFGPGVVINDELYWADGRIYGFNLVTEVFEKKPRVKRLEKYVQVDLFQMKGCLYVHCLKEREWTGLVRGESPAYVSDFWKMEEHDDWKSWKKLFSFRKLRGHIYFSSIGKCLVKCSGHFKLVELTCEALEHGLMGIDTSFKMIQDAREHVESLISSPLGSSESSEYEESLSSGYEESE